MIGFSLCIVAFVCTIAAARRSLAAGLQALLVVGYLYGLARGRFPDGFTHFIFDASLFGLYLGYLPKLVGPELEYRSQGAVTWTRALIIWPMVCMAYSSFLDTSQPLVIQLVGLRGATIMLPCLVLGSRLVASDLDRLAPTLALLNCFALVIAGIEYVFGVGAIVPENLATELIYASHDVVAQNDIYHRIPSCFIHAHMYGATMVLSIPFLLHGLDADKRTRLICMAGLAAAGIGAFVCGARLPVVVLCLASIYALVTRRMRFTTLLAFGIVAVGVYYLVTHNERLQRFETLSDTDYVETRVGNSMNGGFLDLLAQYPFGAGMASAFGTNIPFFMAGLARPPIGIENEYGHILVEQGIPGLLLWMAFLAWLLSRTNGPHTAAPISRTYSTAMIFIMWVTAVIGSGSLVAMPTTPMLLLLCGLRCAMPDREKAQLALRHVGQLRRDLRPAMVTRTTGRGRTAASS